MAKYATINTSNPSRIIIAYSEKEPTNAEFDEYLNEMLAVYEKYKDFVVIYDASKSKYLSSELRIKQGNWLKKYDALIKEKCLGSAYLIPSMMVRLILNGIFLIQKSAVPYTIVASMPEAEKWAAQQLELVSA